jgi:hypothetical protein
MSAIMSQASIDTLWYIQGIDYVSSLFKGDRQDRDRAMALWRPDMSDWRDLDRVRSRKDVGYGVRLWREGGVLDLNVGVR